MIYLLTAHLGGRWVDVQLDYLQRHLHEPYAVWASTEEVPDDLAAKFDRAVPMQGRHPGKLNLLWRILEEEALDDDVVVFLDSDALPIADPMPLIRAGLERNALVAVKRVEDGGDPQPHPCFAAATAGTWRALKCDWSDGYLWRASNGKLTTDVGSNLLYELARHQISWLPLYRTHSLDLHPVLFGVYGGVVYHHGAGSRRFPIYRPETIRLRRRKSRFPLLDPAVNAPNALRRRLYMRRNRRISARIFDRLRTDPDFWRQSVATEPPAAS